MEKTSGIGQGIPSKGLPSQEDLSIQTHALIENSEIANDMFAQITRPFPLYDKIEKKEAYALNPSKAARPTAKKATSLFAKTKPFFVK